MSEFLFLFDYRFVLLLSWLLLSIWGLYVNTFRALVDRVRAGVSSLPNNRIDDKLLHSLLAAPNHERPFHIEAALLSSLQLILGTITFYTFLKQGVESFSSHLIFYFLGSVCIAFLW